MSQSLFASSLNRSVTLIFISIAEAEIFLGVAHVLTTPAQHDPANQMAHFIAGFPLSMPRTHVTKRWTSILAEARATGPAAISPDLGLKPCVPCVHGRFVTVDFGTRVQAQR